MNNINEATFLNGKFKEVDELLLMIPIDMPIEFKRSQFLVLFALAIVIRRQNTSPIATSVRFKFGKFA